MTAWLLLLPMVVVLAWPHTREPEAHSRQCQRVSACQHAEIVECIMCAAVQSKRCLRCLCIEAALYSCASLLIVLKQSLKWTKRAALVPSNTPPGM